MVIGYGTLRPLAQIKTCRDYLILIIRTQNFALFYNRDWGPFARQVSISAAFNCLTSVYLILGNVLRVFCFRTVLTINIDC